MDVPALLWIVFGINTAIYVYVGRFVVSKPRHQHPLFFQNPAVLQIAGVAPPCAYIVVTIAGFVLTDGG